MFGVDSGELFLIVLVAVVVIGPKDLPRVMRTVGHWVGKARGMASQFRLGVDQMVRDSEIADLEQKWREQNEAIMRANPLAPPAAEPLAAETAKSSDSAWGLGSIPDRAPVMKPLGRAAPQPPVGAMPQQPVRPRHEVETPPPAVVSTPWPAAATPDLSKAAPSGVPKRRAPRTRPGAPQ